MARNTKPWMRNEPVQKARKCECGGSAKLRSRMNFPFGMKSRGIKISEYVCKQCQKRSLFNSGKGGK